MKELFEPLNKRAQITRGLGNGDELLIGVNVE